MLPQPFLRWAGGKRRLASLITSIFPAELDLKASRYFEPFVGGGALAFYLGDRNSPYFIPGSRTYLSDSNPDLIAAYQILRDDLPSLIKELKRISKKLDLKEYEKIRSYSPKDKVQKAARFIYLNKTCFNGLWRVNNKGQFNVPWGKLQNPKIFDEEIFRVDSERLRGSKISLKDFEIQLKKTKPGDLVYLDPPYIPLSSSSNFSKYSKNDFGLEDHLKLRETIRDLTNKGVYVILSNSDTSLTRKIFGSDLELYQLNVNRSIAAKASSRSQVMEIVGVNYDSSKLENFTPLKKIYSS